MNKRQTKKKIKKACYYSIVSIELAERMLLHFKIKDGKYMKIVKLNKQDIELIKTLNYEIQHYMPYEDYEYYYLRLFQKLLKGENLDD